VTVSLVPLEALLLSEGLGLVTPDSVDGLEPVTIPPSVADTAAESSLDSSGTCHRK
jgi:hypothetical protein